MEDIVEGSILGFFISEDIEAREYSSQHHDEYAKHQPFSLSYSIQEGDLFDKSNKKYETSSEIDFHILHPRINEIENRGFEDPRETHDSGYAPKDEGKREGKERERKSEENEKDVFPIFC